MKISLRSPAAWLAILTGLLLAVAPRTQAHDLTVGIQTWTLRNLDFDQVVEFCVQHQLKEVQLIDKHMNPKAPPEETRRKRAILEKNGLHVYTFGVAGTSTNAVENRKLFEFAKEMGIKLIIVEPREPAQWDGLEALVKEFDIKLAIHNHGITSTYGNPALVQKLLAARDPRIGVCLDIGHVTGAGFDAAKVFREYNGRVFDLHLKDKLVRQVDGKEVIDDVKIGTGQANFKGLFAELKKAHWHGVLALETDNGDFAKAPHDYVQGALDYVKANQP